MVSALFSRNLYSNFPQILLSGRILYNPSNIEMKTFSLKPDRVITPFETETGLTLSFDESGNFLINPKINTDGFSDTEKINFEGGIALPGFIDVHVHGGQGISFGIGQLREDLEKYSVWAATNGVTGFLMSITGPDRDYISGTVIAYAEILDQVGNWPGAIPLGMHLEGPFLNKEKHGAFNPEWIRNPDLEEMQHYIGIANGWIKHVSMAPELEHAQEVAAFLVEKGIKVSLGHSNTDYETARTALEGNFNHVTHTFNAQSGLHHRSPGVVGAVLSSDIITAELIGDTHHVHPAAMQIMIRCLGAERVILITDAMAGAGLPDGEYELLNQKVTVRAGKATLPDGTIGGSTATMISAVRTLVNEVGVSLQDAVHMASINPAKLIGLDDRIGSIKEGKEGNLVLLDEKMTVQKTFVRGNLVYS
jgi:N-acetylglucosamine-6-phosphate deacetylase